MGFSIGIIAIGVHLSSAEKKYPMSNDQFSISSVHVSRSELIIEH
jgi:hypothetical protein